MSVQVIIDNTILGGQGTAEELCLKARTINDLLEQLDKKYPGFIEKCLAEEGVLKQGYHITVNGIQMDFLSKTYTKLMDGDRVIITRVPPEIRKIYVTIPRELVSEPLIWQLGHTFELVTNIRGSKTSTDSAILALELIGDKDEIQKAIEWLESKGITVDRIDQNSIQNKKV